MSDEIDIGKSLADLSAAELLQRAQPIDLMRETNQCGRVTVSAHFYYEQCGDEKSGESPTFSYLANSVEQAWKRRIKLRDSEIWTPLDLGWLKDEGASLIVISNKTSLRSLPTNPSEEQKKDLLEQVLLIRVGDTITQRVRPGRFTLFEPYDEEEIYLKTAAGVLDINIFAMPK